MGESIDPLSRIPHVSTRAEAIRSLGDWYLTESHYTNDGSVPRTVAAILFGALERAARAHGSKGAPRSPRDLMGDVLDLHKEDPPADIDKATRSALIYLERNLRFFGQPKRWISKHNGEYGDATFINEENSSRWIAGKLYVVRFRLETSLLGFSLIALFSRNLVEDDPDDPLMAEAKADYEAPDAGDRFAKAFEALQSRVSQGERWTLLIEAATTAWEAVARDSRRAARLQGERFPTELEALLAVCVAVAEHDDISSEAFERTIAFTDDLARQGVDGERAATTLQRSFLAHAVLSQPSLFTADRAKGLLEKVAAIPADGWPAYFVDLYYSMLSKQQDQADLIATTVRLAAENYRRIAAGNAPMAALWDFFLAPLDIAREYPLQLVTQRLQQIMKTCMNVRQARLCVRAFHRVVALYDYMSRRHDTRALRSFEERFVNSRGRLFETQITFLQMEYASALYAAIEARVDLRRSVLFNELGSSLTPFASPLLRNAVLNSDALPQTTDVERPSTVGRWLQEYVAKLFRLYRPRIERDILVAQHLRCTNLVPTVRNQLQQFMLASLRAIRGTQAPAAYYAATISLFRFADPGRHLDDMLAHLQAAVASDTYSLVRNSRALNVSAHKCYWFSEDPKMKPAAQICANVVAEAVRTVSVKNDRLSDIYQVSMRYPEATNEQEFVDWFVNQLEPLRASLNILGRGDRSSDQSVQDRMIALLSEYADRSRIASLLKRYYDNASIWNEVGTTITQIRKVNPDVPLVTLHRQAAVFYGLSGVMARSFGEFDQKPSFNYIRARSRALEAGDALDEQFLLYAARHLTLRSSRHFEYWNQCVDPYLAVLRTRWSEIPEEARDRLSSLLMRIVRAGSLALASLPVDVQLRAERQELSHNTMHPAE